MIDSNKSTFVSAEIARRYESAGCLATSVRVRLLGCRLIALFAALVLLALSSLCASPALAACCMIEEINERPTQADKQLIEQHLTKPSSSSIDFRVKHIQGLTIIREGEAAEPSPTLLHFRDGDSNFVVIVKLGKMFYLPDTIIEACGRCFWVRFGSITTREADFLVTGKGVFFAAADATSNRRSPQWST